MPGQLGGLVVSLGLNSAEFSTGLTKAERDVRLFSDRMSGAILKIGGFLGGLAIGQQFLEATKEIISSAAALQNLSGVTGSSVESLSRLANQTKVSGASFQQLETALERLSVNMGGVGKESDKARSALALLGVKATDPVGALNEVALAFAKYEDGARKVAFAQAIFGRSGPEFLKVLKDIAENQDIVATTTTKQAEEADRLEKAFRRLSIEFTGFKNAILENVVPPMTTMLEDFREGIRLAGGFWNALLVFGTINPFESLAEGIANSRREIEALQARKAKGFSLFGGDLFGTAGADLKIAEAQLAFKLFKQRQEALALISPSNDDARDIRARQRPKLPALPERGAADTAAREAKKTLDQQLRALDLFIGEERDLLNQREGFLRTYYQDDQIGLREFFQGRRNALEEAVQKETAAFDKQAELLRQFAAKAKPEARIDAETKLADVLAKRAKLQRDAAIAGINLSLDETRAVNALTEAVERTSIALREMQGDSVGAAGASFDLAHRKILADLNLLSTSDSPGDKALAQQGIAILEQTRQLTIARANLSKVTQSYNLTLDELGIAQQRIDIAQQTGDLTTLGALRAKSELAVQYTAILREQLALVQAQAAQTGRPEDLIRVKQLQVQLEALAATGDLVAKQFNEIFATNFATAISDAVSGTKTLKAAFLDMAKSIEQAITRIAAQRIAESIFGGKSAGSGIGDILSKIFGGLFSGGGGDAFGGAGGGGGFGTLANGTPSWRGGLTVVGERGPEVVNLPRGASVTSNRDSQKLFGPTMNFSINVLPGASTQTAAQAASQTGIAVRRAMARNT